MEFRNLQLHIMVITVLHWVIVVILLKRHSSFVTFFALKVLGFIKYQTYINSQTPKICFQMMSRS